MYKYKDLQEQIELANEVAKDYLEGKFDPQQLIMMQKRFKRKGGEAK